MWNTLKALWSAIKSVFWLTGKAIEATAYVLEETAKVVEELGAEGAKKDKELEEKELNRRLRRRMELNRLNAQLRDSDQKTD